MNKVAIVILAESGSHEAAGRITNAMEFAKELHENGDDVKMVFDGGGVTFIPELEKEDNQMHPLYQAIKPTIEGACKFCSKAFGVIKEVSSSDVELLDDYDDHPSLRSYVQDGYQVVTF